MSHWIVSRIVESEDVTIETYGPFVSHQLANAAMQYAFDEEKSSLESRGESVEADDTDASHFIIVADDLNVDFLISELQPANDLAPVDSKRRRRI